MDISAKSVAHPFRRVLATAAILTIASPAVWSQSVSFRLSCTTHGANWNEPIGDREGHNLQAGDAACVVQGGPIDGAVVTQQSLWEYEKGVGRLVSSHSIYRKPGAMMIAVARSGKLTLQMTEGRMTGWDAAGTLAVAMATGGATGLQQKNGTWTARPTGNRTYVIEVSVE